MGVKRPEPAGKVLTARIELAGSRLEDLQTAMVYGAPDEREFLNNCLRDGLERAIRRGRREHRWTMAELDEAELHISKSAAAPLSEQVDDDVPF